MTGSAEGSPRREPSGLARRVLLGLVLGIAAGVVFGEWTAHLEIVGDVFVGLLQMTVLPYIVVALVPSVGRLSYRELRVMAGSAGAFVVAFWLIAMVVVLGMVACLPDWPSATFFSPSMVQQAAPRDPIELYVPSNPFFSLANGVVPAVVVFSLASGLALIGTPRKDELIRSLEVSAEVVVRIAQFVVRLAPVGVFAIVSATAGTVGLEDLGRLQVYLFGYVVAALLLGLVVLPGAVALLTPIPYRRVISGTQDALITAFAAYNLLIVLPLLAERIKEMLGEAEMLDADTEGAADLLVPLNFNLPNLGKLLALGFVPFAGWLVGSPLAAEQFPQLLAAGLVSLFGETVVALPFLLDLMRVPADTFQVFLAVDQLAGRFGTFVAGMHTVALALLTGAAVTGRLRFSWSRIGRLAAGVAGLGVAGFGGVRLLLEYVVPQQYHSYETFAEMDLVASRVPMRTLALEEVTPGIPGMDRLDAIVARGSLRAGFSQDHLPFVYAHEDGKRVGLDVDIVQMIASDLGVSLDLISLSREEYRAALDTGRVDVLIGGLFATPDRAREFRLSARYLEATLAFVVRDHQRSDFREWERLDGRDDLRLALVDNPFLARQLERKIPGSRVQVVDSPREFLDAGDTYYDALVYSAEAGSAWTLLRPEFSVVVPRPVVSVPRSFGLPRGRGAEQLADYLDVWIALHASSGSIDRLYDYWILGQGAGERKRRWSVVHDVLGWGTRGQADR